MIAGVRNNLADATRWGEEAVEQFRAAGSDAGVASSLTTLAIGPLEFGDPEAAATVLAEAEELHRKLGDAGGLRRVLHLRGQQAVAVGDVERGRRLLRESAELSRAEEDAFGAASSLHSLGDLELEAGDSGAAAVAYQDALAIAWETGADRLVCYCLAGLAATEAGRGDSERAALLWRFVEAYEARLNFTLRRRGRYEECCGLAAAAHGDRYEEGSRLEVDAAVELGRELARA